MTDRSDINRWGRSVRATRLTTALVEIPYRWWFRVKWEHLERIPVDGGALLVANHAGVVPVDGAIVQHGIEQWLGRPVYGLVHHRLREVPCIGTWLARNGAVVAHSDNALMLLRDEGHLALVFPEGTKGTTKLLGERHRVQRFGRGGFVAAAMRAGVPVIPLAIAGSEYTMPAVARIALGHDAVLPVTLNSLLLGPAGWWVHFPAPIRVRVLEPVRFPEPPGLQRYPVSRVADEADAIRHSIQVAVDELRAHRRMRAG